MNRILLTLGLLVCLLQPASGQYRLSGRAIALETGEMLAGVWVNLLDERGIDIDRYASTRTDAEGVFAFDAIREGIYRLEAVRMHVMEGDTVGFRIMTSKITLTEDRVVAMAFSGPMATLFATESRTARTITGGPRSLWLQWRILLQSRVTGTDDNQEVFENLVRQPPPVGIATAASYSDERPAIPHRLAITGVKPGDETPFRLSVVIGDAPMQIIEQTTPFILDVSEGWVSGVLQTKDPSIQVNVHVQRVQAGPSFSTRSSASGSTFVIDTLQWQDQVGQSDLQHYVSAR